MEAIQRASSAMYPNTNAATPQSEGKRQVMKEERAHQRNRAEAGASNQVQFSDAPKGEDMQRIDTKSTMDFQTVAESLGRETGQQEEEGKYGNFDRTA